MVTTRAASVKTLAAPSSLPTLQAQAPASAPASASPRAANGPTRLGHYVLLHELGRGGMGLVHAAYDEQLDRKVAIKVLLAQGDPEAQRRLVREAQALARLSHPNVVQIYEIGDLAGTAFLAMEFVDGVTLRRWRVAQPRSRAEILAVILAAGRGLAAAHAKGLVHRDFKPDNVMIHRDGRVLVMDFGLVRGHESHDTQPSFAPVRGEPGSPLTQFGTVIGTPGYMPPEQFSGRETDERSDQFSFCVSLWELLHQQRPFVGEDMLAVEAAILNGQLNEPARHEVPGWLRAVLVRGLACEPSERWPSMRELLAALAQDPVPRRRALLAGSGLLGLTLAVGVGLQGADARARAAARAACEHEGRAIEVDWNDSVAAVLEEKFIATGKDHAGSNWAHARPWMDRYAHAWATLRTRTCKEAWPLGLRDPAAQATIAACLDERRAAFTGILDVWAETDHSTLRMAATTAAGLPPVSLCTDEAHLARLARAPAEIRPAVVALQLRLERIKARRLAGTYDVALARAESLLPEAQKLGWLPLLAQVRLEIGFDQAALGHYARSRATVEQSFLDAAGSGAELDMLNAATKLSHTVGNLLGQIDQGHYWGKVALALLTHLGMEGSIAEASLRNSIGSIYLKEAAYDQALACYQRALEIFEASLGPEHPAVATSHNNIATALRNQKKYSDSLAPYRRALQIHERALGPEHPTVAYPLHGLGLSLLGLGDLAGARANLERAVALRERTGEPAKLAGSRFGLAKALWASDARSDALVLARAASEGLRDAGAGSEKELAAVELWLQQHPPAGEAP